MTAIIFGASGQDGVYLSSFLKQLGIIVIRVSRSPGWDIVEGDVSDLKFVQEVISNFHPDYVFHLAANSTVKYDAIMENHHTISTGSLNILNSVYRFRTDCKVFLSGSGLQFVNKGLPISESNEFEASSPYSLSRIQSVYAARFFRNLGLKTYIGYFFNHDSPLRSERHVNQKIVQSVKRIAHGSSELLEISNPMVRKEFCFAGDVVEAVWTLVNSNHVFEAVIGSGKAYSIENWLEICFNYFNLDWRKHVASGPPLRREYDILVSDPSTIFSLGWKPKVDIEGLAKLMIEA